MVEMMVGLAATLASAPRRATKRQDPRQGSVEALNKGPGLALRAAGCRPEDESEVYHRGKKLGRQRCYKPLHQDAPTHL